MSEIGPASDVAAKTGPGAGDSDEAFTLAFLNEREAACPACGYNVHRLTVPRCPECGIALTVRVVSLEGVSKSWVTALVASAVGAGIGVLLLVVVLQERWPPRDWVAVQLALVYFLAMIPVPAVVLVARPWLVRWRVASLALAVILWVGVLGMMALFFWGLKR